VAVGLAVSPQAVELAYDRLEQAGLLTRAEGCGPRVAGLPASPVGADLRRLCEGFLRAAAERGYPLATVLHALGAYLAEEVCHE
jgi:hypothetical protein